ncbi:MAG: hypothetical protein RMK99_09620 [Anaerolineales bacterium]|nr:hypothetical protein [Anaerolineales bacterium]
MLAVSPGNPTGTLYYLHSDHPSARTLRMPLRTSLGSISAVTDRSDSAIRTPTPTATLTPTPTAPGCPSGDDFNRADSTTLGPNWTERSGDWAIVSQTLRNASTGGDIVASWNGGPYTNVAVSAQVQNTGSNGTTTLGVRWNANGGVPTQGYNVDLLGNGAVTLFRVSDWAVLGTYTIPGYTAGAWYTLTLRANGSTLSVDVNGVTRLSATDGAFTSGAVGVWSYNSVSAGEHRFDNFSVTVLGGGGHPKARGLARPVAQAAPSAPPANHTLRWHSANAAQGRLWRLYYHANGRPIALRVLPPGHNTGTLYFLHSDHPSAGILRMPLRTNLGSLSAVTNRSGSAM